MNSRRKGHDGEREVAALLRQALQIEITRNLQQTRDGGHDLEVCGFGLECKRAATVSEAKVARWWQQAIDQADRAGLIPALAYRADRQPWTVRLPLSVLRPEILGELTVDLGLDGFVALVRCTRSGSCGGVKGAGLSRRDLSLVTELSHSLPALRIHDHANHDRHDPEAHGPAA